MSETLPKLAVIGGTGDLGGGLARRWAAAGYPIIIGSRSEEKAKGAAEQIRGEVGGRVEGMENAAAAAAADLVVLTVPFASQKPNLEAIRDCMAGKILLDATVPLQPPKVATVQLPVEGSAGPATKIPLRRTFRTYPSRASSSIHRSTVAWLTLYSARSFLILGRRSPGARVSTRAVSCSRIS